MSALLTQLFTAQDFRQLPESNLHRELVQGEVVETMPPGGQHGAIAVMLAMLLRLWAKEGTGGYVGVAAGYILARYPDTVRGPDVSYVRASRISADGVPEGFWDLAPDLAVEVVSPHESADEVRAKVRDFLNAGTPMVWTIYPRGQEVIVHTPDGLARTYTGTMTLEFPEVLPGFACTVSQLFE
jgi:Uma2 family endonuclease